jgi:hypothetical protein
MTKKSPPTKKAAAKTPKAGATAPPATPDEAARRLFDVAALADASGTSNEGASDARRVTCELAGRSSRVLVAHT